MIGTTQKSLLEPRVYIALFPDIIVSRVRVFGLLSNKI